MRHTYTSLMVHVVFATKDRRPMIDPALEERLFPYFGGILRELGGRMYTANGSDDHVHVLASLPPAIAIADVLEKMKGSSSKWIHETFPGRSAFRWQRGYSGFSVSQSQVSRVASYIERQKEHHTRTSFHDEYVALLRCHRMSIESR